jgi:hypothetical protein
MRVSHLKPTIHHLADTRGSSRRSHQKVASSSVALPHTTHVALHVDRTHNAVELRVADINSENHALARKNHTPRMGERDEEGTSLLSSTYPVESNTSSTQHQQQTSLNPKKTTTPMMSPSPTIMAYGASSSTGPRNSTRSMAPWRARSSQGYKSGPSQTWLAL